MPSETPGLRVGFVFLWHSRECASVQGGENTTWQISQQVQEAIPAREPVKTLEEALKIQSMWRGSECQSEWRTSAGPPHTCGALDSTRFRNTEAADETWHVG